MKYLFLPVLSVILCTFSLSAQNTEKEMCQLTIHFDTPKGVVGRVGFVVYNNPDNYGDSKKFYNCGIVDPPMVTISLPYGEYAVSCYEDTNGDGKMDTNLLGIPSEPVGASDNFKMTRKPKWEDVAFSVNQPKQEITIELKTIF